MNFVKNSLFVYLKFFKHKIKLNDSKKICFILEVLKIAILKWLLTDLL